MPNWCNNLVTISHDDSAAIDRVETAYRNGRLLEEFVPVPEALKAKETATYGGPDAAVYDELREQNRQQYGYGDWWTFCVNEWGTKWDVGGGEEEGDIRRLSPTTVQLRFDSAWAPPVMAFERMLEFDYNIVAYYWEPGMCFAGTWDNGSDDFYEYSDMTADEIEQKFPNDLQTVFEIADNIRSWQEIG